MGIEQQHSEMALALFRAVQTEFVALASIIKVQPIPEIAVELTFDAQKELIFPVVATLQGDELCLSVGMTFFGEWFPCSDKRVVSEFRNNLCGVLAGYVRLVEFSRDDRVIKAQLQECPSGYWEPAATWTKARWPSFRRPSVRVVRNRPTTLRAGDPLDRALLADIRDDGGDPHALVEAMGAMRYEAKPGDLPWLKSLLKDKSPLVREAAAWPIVSLEGLPALRDLLVAFQRGLNDGGDQDSFAALLIDMVTANIVDSVPELRTLLGDSDLMVQENAKWLLGHCEGTR